MHEGQHEEQREGGPTRAGGAARVSPARLQRGRGRCAVTGQEFTDEQVGTGKAKRAFAPSLDRIDPEDGYHQANCRLVMAAVNFGMNAWGLEVYLEVARAALKHSG